MKETESKRIAVPVWDQRVAPVFDVAGKMIWQEIASGSIPETIHPVQLPSGISEKIELLTGLRIHTLICGAVSKPILNLLQTHGIEVIPFVTGNVEDIISAWKAGRLNRPEFAMPGCGCRWGFGPAGKRNRRCGRNRPGT